jgi:hypothetical protein
MQTCNTFKTTQGQGGGKGETFAAHSFFGSGN